MKQIAIVFTLLILACSPKIKQNTSTLDYEKLFIEDTVKYAILSIKDNKYIVKDTNVKSFNLISDDIAVLDSLLSNFTQIYNQVGLDDYQIAVGKNPNSEIKKRYFIIDMNNYKKQYVPYLNTENEKIVFSNYFCELHGNHNWKKHIIRVFDGGNCFFTLNINLTQKKIIYYSINGDA